MNTYVSNPERSYQRWLVGGIILFIVLGGPSESIARQSSATISGLKGHVKLYGRSVSPVIGRPVKIGEALQAGDRIQTENGAQVTLTFIEGSVIKLAMNTSVDLVTLEEDASTGARKSELLLHGGRVHATLSAGHQKEGSSFRVATPNMMADVTFSRPVIEVSYDPDQKKTTIDAYTVDVIVRNMLTGRSMTISPGQQGIINRNRKLSVSPILPQPGISVPEERPESVPEELPESVPEELPESVPEELPESVPEPPKPKQSSTNSLQQTRNDVRQATSVSNPSSIVPETSTNPSPSVRPGSPERQPRIVIIHLREE